VVERDMGNIVEELTKQWGKLMLREDENPRIVIQEQSVTQLVQQGQACLIGKLLTERSIGKEILKTPMIRVWRPTGRVTFKTLGTNLFLIEFENWWEKDRILEGHP
jgi:hypothetical protein